VGGGGGEGIVHLDFGAREAMGRGCGRVVAGRAACSHCTGWRPTASRQELFGLISTLKNQAKFRPNLEEFIY